MRCLNAFLILLMLVPTAHAVDITTCQTIDTSGTYVLQNDLTSDGTCITITEPNVEIDLGGHTITYDNRAQIVVPNGSFESVLTGNWDVTNAANASRQAGMFVGTTVSKYDGDYALRVTIPFTGAQYIRSSQITLAANTTYHVSGMFRNSGNYDTPEPATGRDNITIKIELEGETPSATLTGISWRGFAHTGFLYTTGGSPENHIIRITVDNAAGVPAGNLYIDDIEVLMDSSFGVAVSNGSYPNAANAYIHNGVITQGQGGGNNSHAIFVHELGGNGWHVSDLSLTTHGPNSSPFVSYYTGNNSSIHDCVIAHHTTKITSRDQRQGSSIYIPANSSTPGKIYNNIITHSPQTAIATGSVTTGRNEIYNNTIAVQSLYTNDFAIGASGWIHHNTIDCLTGSNACRGITIGGTNEVNDNVVSVRNLPRNQEYNGCQAAGAYATQAEYGTVGAKTYNNIIYAETGGGVCEAAGIRLNDGVYDGSTNIEIYNNSVTVKNTGTANAYILKLANIYGSGIDIHDNTFVTNGRFIYLDYDDNPVNMMEATLSGNTYDTLEVKLPDPYYPFLVNGGVHGVFTLSDSIFGRGDAQRFWEETFRTGAGAIDATSDIILTNTSPITVSTTTPSGKYHETQTVSLYANKEATILYCTSLTSSTCAPSTTYTAPFTLLQNVALQYYCYNGEDLASNLSTTVCEEVRKQRVE